MMVMAMTIDTLILIGIGSIGELKIESYFYVNYGYRNHRSLLLWWW